MSLDLNNKNVLITGGTGSFGKTFVQTVLQRFPKVNKLIVFSRDELKQYEMSKLFPDNIFRSMRYFLGDVRDRDRLQRAFENVDVVVHAAALKQVPAAEYNPIEFVKTNVLGAENVISSAIEAGVKDVIALSTDKAAAPINLYGATKLCSDKLFVAANNIIGKRDLRFSVVRYGNVMGSRGSVIPYFLEKKKEGVLPITHPEMTRFNITLKEGVELVLYALEHAWGGEIFVPKSPSYKITELAKAIGPDCKIKITGIRAGEKLHEDMITDSDSINTLDAGTHYVILPPVSGWTRQDYIKRVGAKPVKKGFRYSSDTNKKWLNAGQLKKMILENINAGL